MPTSDYIVLVETNWITGWGISAKTDIGLRIDWNIAAPPPPAQLRYVVWGVAPLLKLFEGTIDVTEDAMGVDIVFSAVVVVPSVLYSGNPSSSPKDAVRFLINDTIFPFRFNDEEIQWALLTEGNYWLASALLCIRSIEIAGAVSSKTVGSLSISYASETEWWSDRAKLYRMRGSGRAVPTIATIPQKFSFNQFDGRGGRGPRVREASEQ